MVDTSARRIQRANDAWFLACLVALPLALSPAAVRAVDSITVLPFDANQDLDPPTLLSLGVRLRITGDDDFDAAATLRYRKTGTCGRWRSGLDLFRVRLDGVSVPTEVGDLLHKDGAGNVREFAGSVFNLDPDTEYEIEVTVADPDGVSGPAVQTISGRTRPPVEEAPPPLRTVNVSTPTEFSGALTAAIPGDEIIVNGTITGNFVLSNDGSADHPIVIRGNLNAQIDGGGGCPGSCSGDALKIHGSFVRVEDLTITNAFRGIHFPRNLGQSTDNVVRRVQLSNVRSGITSAANQTNYYVCDNTLQGLLSWPAIYADDGGAHANEVGIRVSGTGHVICHNRIAGFGDAIRLQPDECCPTPKVGDIRGVDVYGNDVRSSYDDGLELDYSIRNVRAFRNRFLNTYVTMAFQPIYSGPAYAFRNVAINVAREQLKFGSNNGDPRGMFVLHNTFVSAPLIDTQKIEKARSLQLIKGALTSHDYMVLNNLFVGPNKAGLKTVRWLNEIDRGEFDHNGYYPDGPFQFDTINAPDFANLVTAPPTPGVVLEPNGRIVAQPLFASGLQPPASYTVTINPDPPSSDNVDVELDATSNALDAARLLPGLNNGGVGNGPDLGALEHDCATQPFYGPRPPGTDERNLPAACQGLAPIGCAGDAETPLAVCPPAPVATCSSAGRMKLRLKRREGTDERNDLNFRWSRGTSAAADFGDPLSTATYYACLYEGLSGGGSRLLLSAVAAAGGDNCGISCGPRACWKANYANTKWTYRDRSYSPHGLRDVKLASHPDGKAKIKLIAKGDCLGLPSSLELQAPVTLQLHNTETPVCWEGVFEQSHIRRALPRSFSASYP